MTSRDLLDQLEAEELRLVFDAFDEQTAWALGTALRATAVAGRLPVAIAIRCNGRLLFHAACPGSSADNEGWLARKSAVVDRYGQSSLRVGEGFRARGKSFEEDSRLDPRAHAAHGGAFPVTVRDVGCVGTIAVSGLPQVEDHRLVVEVLRTFLEKA